MNFSTNSCIFKKFLFHKSFKHENFADRDNPRVDIADVTKKLKKNRMLIEFVNKLIVTTIIVIQ